MSAPILKEKPQSNAGIRIISVPDWLRSPTGAIIIVSLSMIIVGTVALAAEIGQPFGGFASYGYLDRDNDFIASETPIWWPPLVQNLLEHDDRLLSINGMPYRQHMWDQMSLAYDNGENVILEVLRLRNSDTFSVAIIPVRFSAQDFLDLKLPNLLVAIVFWLLAVIVLKARPDMTTNRVFAATAACVAAQRATAVASLSPGDSVVPNLLVAIHVFLSGLSAALILHLALVFPRPVDPRFRRLIVIYYVLGILTGVIVATTRLPVWKSLPEHYDVLLDNTSYRLMVLLTASAILILIARLAWIFFHSRASPRDRRVVGIVFAGLIVSLPAIIVILAPVVQPFGGRIITFLGILDLRYFLLAIPIAFAIAIVRYQTFQSPSSLFMGVIVLSMSAYLAAIGVAVWSLTLSAGSPLPRPPFITFFAFIFAASFFWSRQADWRGWFGRFLNREDRNYESARSFGNRVIGRNDLRVLPSVMAQALVDELELESAAVWLTDAETRSFRLVATAGNTEPRATENLPIKGSLPSRAVHVAWPSTPNWLSEPIMKGHFEVVIPLLGEGKPIGLLALGPRWDEEIFDERDLAVADLVGQQATLFIQAAIQVEELRRVPMRVAEAQERERFRLASELHDTIQQFLGRLPFFLVVSQELMETDRQEAANILDQCMTDVEDAARVLREIRANLAPNQLEVSLTKPLTGLIAHVQRHSGLEIELDSPEDLDDLTTIGTRQALYRVIQQALDNTVAHAGASKAVIALHKAGDRVHFSVTDNGHGPSAAELSAALASGSFGLQSMRARIETVGGEFQFETNQEKGTVVAGWVPASA